VRGRAKQIYRFALYIGCKANIFWVLVGWKTFFWGYMQRLRFIGVVGRWVSTGLRGLSALKSRRQALDFSAACSTLGNLRAFRQSLSRRTAGASAGSSQDEITAIETRHAKDHVFEISVASACQIFKAHCDCKAPGLHTRKRVIDTIKIQGTV